MACGIGLLGSVSALLASWFVEQARRAGEAATAAAVAAVDDAAEELEDAANEVPWAAATRSS